MLSDVDVLSAELPENLICKLFLNRRLSPRARVAVRLNLNGSVVKDGVAYSLQTIHNGGSVRGRVIGYDHAVMLEDAKFWVSQASRAKIASGASAKFPMAAVAGAYVPYREGAHGSEIRFNPKTSHLFTCVTTGWAVKSAEKVLLWDRRAYATGLTYWSEAEAPRPASGLPSDVRFVPPDDE